MSDCTSCVAYASTSNPGTCDCDLKYYDDDPSDHVINCVGCATECETCDGGSNDDCLTCDLGYYL